MQLKAAYPTLEHTRAAQAIVEFFTTNYQVDAVLLVNSCARGKATRDSCLDMLVLVQPEALRAQRSDLERAWEAFDRTSPVVQALRQAGKYSQVHLDVFDGVFAPAERAGRF
jgi:predicted nucleotidyltransferase